MELPCGLNVDDIVDYISIEEEPELLREVFCKCAESSRRKFLSMLKTGTLIREFEESEYKVLKYSDKQID